MNPAPASRPSLPTTATPAAVDDLPELVLEADQPDRHYWCELWAYRELLGFLAWRDIKIRYKQAVLGAGWAVVQPLVTMAIFTFVFGRLARIPDGGVAYPLLVLAGLLPWQLFSTGISGSSNSIVANTHLVSKVYFPRLLVPIASIGVAIVDFAVVLGLFLVASLWFGLVPDWHWLLLPVFGVLAVGLALGAGLWLTSLTVRYRDFRFIVPFLLQVGLFVSPVGFRTDNFPGWRALFALNPLSGVIDGFRWCLLHGQQALDPWTLATAAVGAVVLVVTGVWYFRRTERDFADIL